MSKEKKIIKKKVASLKKAVTTKKKEVAKDLIKIEGKKVLYQTKIVINGAPKIKALLEDHTTVIVDDNDSE